MPAAEVERAEPATAGVKRRCGETAVSSDDGTASPQKQARATDSESKVEGVFNECCKQGSPTAQQLESESASNCAPSALMISGTDLTRKALEGKMEFRDAATIRGLLPRGSAGLKTKMPKRKDFGTEGEEGDAAHGAAMEEFSLKEFGSSHVQARTDLS